MLVDILAFDGVDELDVVAPLEVFRRARSLVDDLEVRLVSVSGRLKVRGASDLVVQTEATFRPGDADILIVPGGGWVARTPTGAWGEHERGELEPQLAVAAARSRILAGVCTGTMLLAHAGVIAGRRATTHHGAFDELAELGVHVVRQRVVDDGDLVTCGGVTSGIDLALWLVARELGDDVAEGVARAIEYEWFRPARG